MGPVASKTLHSNTVMPLRARKRDGADRTVARTHTFSSDSSAPKMATGEDQSWYVRG